MKNSNEKTLAVSSDSLINGKYDVMCSFKENKDGLVTKKVTLRFNLDNVKLIDIITPALANKKIVWQNGIGRSKFASWKDGQVVEVEYKNPATNVKTEEERILETKTMFMKAGLGEKEAQMLAEKAVKNPEILR